MAEYLHLEKTKIQIYGFISNKHEEPGTNHVNLQDGSSESDFTSNMYGWIASILQLAIVYHKVALQCLTSCKWAGVLRL